MPDGGDSDGSNSPPPASTDFCGFRSTSVDRSQGIYQEVQAAVNRQLEHFRTESSVSEPDTQNSDLTLQSENWSFDDIGHLNVTTSTPVIQRHERIADIVGTRPSKNSTKSDTDINSDLDKDNPNENLCFCEGSKICDLCKEDLVFEEPQNIDSVESRPTSAASQSTVIEVDNLASKMPPPNLKKNLDIIQKCTFIWDNNYAYLTPKNVPQSQLAGISSEIQDNVAELSSAIIYFTSNPNPESYTPEVEERAKNCLLQFNGFRKLMWEENEARLDIARVAEAQRTAAANGGVTGGGASVAAAAATALLVAAVPKQRLTTGLNNVNNYFEYVVRDFKEVMRSKPTSTQALKSLDVVFKQVIDRQKETQKQVDELVKCGTTVGDANAVQVLDGYTQKMMEMQYACRDHIENLYEELGLLPGLQDPGVNRIKIKPPTFSGDYTNGNVDFYTFKTALDNFFDILPGLSDYEKCLKLQYDCVTGQAKDSIMNFESYKLAMAHLKSIFGNPELLYSAKAKGIKGCGYCPDNLMQKRDWIIRINHKLSELIKLAKGHKIMDLFESSNVLAIIMGALQKDDNLKFHKKLKKDKISFPDRRQTKCVMIELLSEFLEHLVWETTANIDISVTSGSKSFTETKAAKSGDKHTHKYNAGPEEGSYNVMDTIFDDNDNTSDDDSVDNCNDHITAAHVYTPKPESGEKSKKKKVNNKGGQKTSKDKKDNIIMMNKSTTPKSILCKLCDQEHKSLVYCEKFQEAKVKRRFGRCIKSQSCYRCLRLDSAFDFDNREKWFKDHKPYCDDKWLCNVGKCQDKDDMWRNHILVCSNHIEENMEREAEFKASLDQNLIKPDVHFYFATYHAAGDDDNDDSKNIDSIAVNGPDVDSNDEIFVEPEVKDSPVYLLQYIEGKNGEKLLTFFDSGCYSAGLSDRAYAALDTVTTREGPTTLQVAGGAKILLPHGDEQFWLELCSDKGQKSFATLRGLRMSEISCKFPTWPLTEAYNELILEYTKLNTGIIPPKVEEEIGGQTVDLMIGIKYAKYYPKLLFTLPSGLSLYQSKLKGYGGFQGVLGGPHNVWKNVMSSSNLMGPGCYLSSEFRAYKCHTDSLWSNIGISHKEENQVITQHSLHFFCSECSNPLADEDIEVARAIYSAGPSKLAKEYQIIDQIGSELGYRCYKCRNCNDCRNGEHIEAVSLVEEREQHQIEQSLDYDHENKKVMALLPFIDNPDKALAENSYIAEKILSSQLKIANKSEDSKNEILKSFEKLESKGHIVPLSSLPEEEQVLARKPGYTIPWRVHWKPSSTTTPVRPVFDGSSKTKTGSSLNDILAKGSNQMAKMLHLLIAFRYGGSALTSDVRMAYNSVSLKPEHYRYQKFLWVHGLDLLGAIVIYIIKTLIYGIRSSGNQTIHGFKIVANEAEAAEPDLKVGADTLRDKTYVDDIVATYKDNETRDKAADALISVLDYGQMTVKAVTKSGYPPDESVSVDGESVGLVGYSWKPVEDTISLEIKPLYLEKSKRGKLPEIITGDIKEALKPMLTKRVLLGKVMGVYDPIGLCTPLTSKLKVDLSVVIQADGDWDDKLSEEDFLDNWVQNLMLIQSLRGITFQRSVFCNPVDVNSGVELIVSTDASQVLAAACIHARMRLLTGEYVCSLVASKSKLASKNTIPKSELIACTMGCVLGHLVKINFEDSVKNIIYVTDSMVALYWLHCDSRPMQTGIRNLVIESRRFCQPSEWNHVESAQNVADIATRPESLPEIGPESEWQCGKQWMVLPRSDMPIKSIEQINLSQAEQNEAFKEIRVKASKGMVLINIAITDKMNLRYDYTDYEVDPCKYPWNKYLRIIATCYRVADRMRKKSEGFVMMAGSLLVDVHDDDLKKAEKYLFKKTTLKVQHFNCKEKLKKVGKMVDGVLVYQGRILPSADNQMAGVMLDLDKLAFAKPVLDRHSPCSYAIMLHCHEKVTHHGGAISTLRRSREIAFIMNAKSLANEIRDKCLFCRRYKARCVEVELGKLDNDRLIVGPAFTITQVDIFGPVQAKCPFGRHKETPKLWACVYKCPVTLAVAAYAMEKYDTESVIQTFTRHINRYGVPQKIKIDAGSQLIKAFQDMDVCIAEVQNLLNQEKGTKIEFVVGPVGGHNYQGVVERSIRSIKEIMNVVFYGFKFSPTQFETVLSYCCNELNSMPLCLGNRYVNIEELDLITPSRLMLGRNNNRAPGGQVTVDRPTKILESMERIEEVWWETWKNLKIGDYIPKPNKWLKTTDNVREGDIVIFKRDPDNPVGTCIWRIGRIKTAEKSRDDKVRTVEIEYRNYKERELRTTRRAVRTIAVIHKEQDMDFVGELGAVNAEMNLLLQIGP